MKDLIGKGQNGDVYAGKTKRGTKVAVKLFSNLVSSENYVREIECYQKLGALTDDKCKMYGVPPILFYGYSNGTSSHLLVIPRYKSTLKDFQLNDVYVSDESMLSIMQQLVITMKYLHAHGVRHGDAIRGNMMVELNQVYLIDYGNPRGKDLPENHDMLDMFLAICGFFDLEDFMREKVYKVGLKMVEQKEEIIKEVIAKNTINSKYAKPLVEFVIAIAVTYLYNRLPNYKKLYGILDEALYPGGDHSKRIFFNWLSYEEKIAAKKVRTGSIESIEFNRLPA